MVRLGKKKRAIVSGSAQDHHYQLMHAHQTPTHASMKKIEYDPAENTHRTMSIWEALAICESISDSSDPDFELGNMYHGYQTAESLRSCYPDQPWLPLVGLIHDVGKILLSFGEPEWAVFGDTHVLDLPSPDCLLGGTTGFPPRTFRVYDEGCGVDELLLSWGHDEYLYQVLLANKTLLPPIALRIIRYHSFYPWHCDGAYERFANQEDRLELLPWLKIFSSHDLYSKSEKVPDVQALRPYYEKLAQIYLPDSMIW